MALLSTAWQRWRQFAHRAAVVQSHVLLFLLYVIVLIPTAGAFRLFGRRRLPIPSPSWVPVGAPPDDLAAARNQF